MKRSLTAFIHHHQSLHRKFSVSSTTILPPFHEKNSQECLGMKQQLQERGFVVSPNQILSFITCQDVKDRMPALFHGDFETGIYPDEWHWRQGMGREDVTREMCNTWKSDRLIASIILSEHLGQLVGNVMGWPSVRIAQDDLIWKPPCQPKTVVGFHQDSAYISSQFEPYENNSVTVWIALDDADVETGCVEYVAGSHQWRPLKHLERQSSVTNEGVIMKESAVFHTCDAETYRHSLPNNEGANAEPVPVKEGYAIFHHQDVWHGSGPNQSATKHRRALVGHYIRGDIEFRGNGDSTSCTPWGNTSYIYGRYKRYKSTQVDESFFPITFAVDGCGQARTPWIDHFLKKH